MPGLSMTLAPARFSFNFLLLFLFPLHPNFNSRYNKGTFPAIKGKEGRRGQMKFVKAIVSNIRFPITFTD